MPLPPPTAPRRPHVLRAHGDDRTDDWYWLRDRDNPEVISYLQAENAYAAQLLEPTEDLQRTLFEQIKARIKETDVTAPVRDGAWWYWSQSFEGKQYWAHRRLHDPERALSATEALGAAERGEGTTILDENEAAGGSEYFALGVFDISPDHRLLAYAVDLDGSERYRLAFRDLRTGSDLADIVEGVSYGSAWAADGTSLFYVRPDEMVRPYQIWRHVIGSDAGGDTMVYEDTDERFFVGLGTTRSRRYILFTSDSKMSSEVSYVEAADPAATPRVIQPREQGLEYDVEHGYGPATEDVWFIRANADGASNFALFHAPVDRANRDNWQTVLAHRPDVKLEAVDAFKEHVVVAERESAIERLRVIHLPTGEQHLIDQPDPVYSLGTGANPEFDSTTLRFSYTSLVQPTSTIEYDMARRERALVKVQTVLGGYDASTFVSERLWAEAADGARVPISLVRSRNVALDGTAPLLLYGYGAYEATIDPTFSSSRLNLLERGFVFAIAHIRGGGELGRGWYEQGRLLHKANTFTDFIACAEHLIAAGYTTPDRLVIRGGSAGGLLMGAVTNMRPDLWRAVVAEVPFVDCLTTMQDVTLPLTVTEWEEWGNPVEDAEVYRYMKSYSPYDNVAPRDYPAMYVTGGLNDPRVGFWEPAKWVAKLRALRTNDAPLLLKTEMDAGHQGPSGRYDAWRDEARVHAFVLSSVDRGS